MRKAIALMLAAILLLATAAMAEGTRDTLNVAVTTPMTGNFFTSRWGNNTSDTDVRALIHGYNLVVWDASNGMFVTDPTVVSELSATQAPDGSRTYTLTLYDDLMYCDGTPITAWDYAFAILLELSPAMAELSGTNGGMYWLAGAEAYTNGETGTLAGVHVPADDQIAITVRGEFLPFFFELGLLNCNPYPIGEIAPGAGVADDGDGAYLTGTALTAELLSQTLRDPATGYCTHPAVTSGAYVLASYEDGVATFALNPNYKGDAWGNKPSIANITFRSMAQDELIAALRDGSIDIVNKATAAQVIENGLALTGEEGAAFAEAHYARSGLAFLSFNTTGNAGVTADPLVRDALASLIDRDLVTSETVGDYGVRADGYYGIGQWMVRLLNGSVEYPVTGETEEEKAVSLALWQELSLESLSAWNADAARAAELLDEAGWTLGEDGVRRNADGEALTLAIAYAAGSAAGESLEQLVPVLAEAGIEATVTAVPLGELLGQYYHTEESGFDLIFLATNFELVYDPSAGFRTNENGEHVWYTSGMVDEELYEAAVSMRLTEPGDLLGYCSAWLMFQQRFMEILPALPVYSNIYYDFYPVALQGYEPAANISWAQAVISASFGEAAEDAPAVEGD